MCAKLTSTCSTVHKLSLLKLLKLTATIILFFEHLHDEDNPQKNPRCSIEYLGFDLIHQLATSSFQLAMQIINGYMGVLAPRSAEMSHVTKASLPTSRDNPR
jgi:hypothetical protein